MFQKHNYSSWGSPVCVVEDSVLLGYDAASVVNWFPGCQMHIYRAFKKSVTEVEKSWTFWPLKLRPLRCLKNVSHQSPSDIVPHPGRMETSPTLPQKSKISQLILQVFQTVKHIFSSIWFQLWQASLWQTRIWWLLSSGMRHLVVWQMWISVPQVLAASIIRVGHVPWEWSEHNLKCWYSCRRLCYITFQKTSILTVTNVRA
jgi:hypothetical protein